MNEKFGFLSNFPGLNLKLKKKANHVPIRGELTDNPPIRQNDALLTDDDDSSNDSDNNIPKEVSKKEKSKPIINRILESSTSSNLTNGAVVPENISSPLKNLSIRDTPVKKHKRSSGRVTLAETVVGSFSGNDLCSQMSEMNVKTKERQEKLLTPKNRNKVRDTVIGSFSDLDEDEVKSKLPDTVIGSFPDKSSTRKIKENAKVLKIRKRRELRDTIVGPFSDSEDEQEGNKKNEVPDTVIGSFGELSNVKVQPKVVNKKPRPPKPSLPETVIGFSESMMRTSSSFILTSTKIQQKIPKKDENEEIYSESDDNDDEEDEEDVITISDSDEEDISVDEPPLQDKSHFNCSTLCNPDESVSDKRESDTTLNRFFNNPPSIKNPDHVVTHSVIRGTRTIETVEKEVRNLNVSGDRLNNIEEADENFGDEIEIGETDLSDVQQTPQEENKEKEKNSDAQTLIPSQSEVVSSEELSESKIKRIKGRINISAHININLKIRIPSDDTTSSSSDESSSDSSPEKPKSTSKRNESNINIHLEKQKGMQGNVQIKTPTNLKSDRIDITKQNETTPKTPEIVLDDDLQEILTNLYGETWKTPQLLRSCKSKKVRQNLRKSIHANNFQNFIQDLPKEIESPKISSDEDEVKLSTPKAPIISSTKKKNLPSSTKTTPRYLEICDSDTPSEDSSDDDFNPNETWNASSDEEYISEGERIKKRNVSRKSHKDEEIIFVPNNSDDDREKKLDELLYRYEFKKPQGMQTPDMKKPSKRKLFTHSHYEDEDEVVADERNERNEDARSSDKENELNTIEVIFPRPLPRPLPSNIKDSGKKKSPSVKNTKMTPKSKTQTPKLNLFPINKFGTYSFLKSLDAEGSQLLCDPEALSYRKNYKSKKNELTEKLFKLYNEKIFDGQLSEVQVIWNKKLLNTAGRCNNCRRNGIRESKIDLSDKVLTSADRLRCTLIHEMCHAATWILNGGNGHGATWKAWASKANQTFPELPKINVCHNYIIEYRYTYQCVNCKAKHQAHSKSKKVENIRCSVCKGPIELFLNKKNKDGEVVITPVAKEVRGFPKFVKMKYKEVKTPSKSHKDVMQILSSQFASLTVEQKQNL